MDVEPDTLYKTLINITTEAQADTLTDAIGGNGKNTGDTLGNVKANLLLDAFTDTISRERHQDSIKHTGRCNHRGTN